MKNTLLFLLLLASGTCVGITPVYVDPGWVGTEIGTQEEPYNTIEEAITNVEAGGSIKLMVGDYNAHSIILNSAANKDIIFQSNTSRVKLCTDIEASVLFQSDLMGYTFTFKNIEFSVENGGNSFLHYYSTSYGNAVFEDCVFTQHSTIHKPLTKKMGSGINSGYGRNMTFRRCDFSANITSAISVGNCNRFILDNCNLTFSANANLDRAIFIVGSCIELVVKKCTIDTDCDLIYTSNSVCNPNNLILKGNKVTCSVTANNVAANLVYLLSTDQMDGIQIQGNAVEYIYTPTAQELVDEKKYFNFMYMRCPAGRITVSDNDISTAYPNYHGTALYIDTMEAPIIMSGNRFTGFNFGINSKSTCIAQNNILICSNPITLSGIGNLVSNNTLIAIDGHVPARPLLFQRTNVTPKESSINTVFTPSTVECTDGLDYQGGTWDLSGVKERMICVTKAAPGDYSSTYWGYVMLFSGNTLTVDRWLKVSDSSIETPPAGSYVQVLVFATNNVVYNNIFDSAQGTYGVNYDHMPLEGNNYCDYNCYVAGSNSISNLGYSVNGWENMLSLAELQARWLAFSPGNPYNDCNSVEVDPQYNADYVPLNFEVLQGGKPDILGNPTHIGAINADLPEPCDIIVNWLSDEPDLDINNDGNVNLFEWNLSSKVYNGNKN